MPNLAVFASGNGSNFQAIAERIKGTPHNLEFLLCNKKSAYAFERAGILGIRAYYVSYLDRSREDAEKEMLELCDRHSIHVIALAGFMRLFTPWFLENFKGDILNLHPSLLPKYPGTEGIRESWESGDPEIGISIIRVDKGVDTGPVLLQKQIARGPLLTLDQAEAAIHGLEHEWYPKVVIEKLDSCSRG